MVLLAGTASCSCDSYDPDPYDDVPPVVRVDFNYVVPAAISVRAPRIQAKSSQRIAVTFYQLQDFAMPQFFLNSHVASPLGQSVTNLVVPLRR